MTTAICQDCLDAWASEWPAGDVSVRGFDEATGKPLWQCHTCFELERLGIQRFAGVIHERPEPKGGNDMTRKIIVMAGSQVFTTIIRNESLFPLKGHFNARTRTKAAPKPHHMKVEIQAMGAWVAWAAEY